VRWFAALVVVVACNKTPVDPNACIGGIYYEIPDGCDDVNCEDIICDAVCPMGQSCPLLDCKGSPQCRLDCQATDCTNIDCDQSSVCFIDCHDPGASCEVSCLDSQDCTVGCERGAECLLHCGSGSACRFDMCDGSGMVDCGSGVIACNRPCP
jgi:hypothetical protein